jgi:hypothetical protein
MCKSWVQIPPPSPHKVKTPQGEGLKTMPEGIKIFFYKSWLLRFKWNRGSRFSGFNETTVSLKGQCHEIFDPGFFHQTIPPRVLFHGLKPFAYGFVFTEKIEIIVCKVQIPRSQWDRRIESCGLKETRESNPEVSMRPTWKVMRLRQWTTENMEIKLKIFVIKFPRCQWDRGIGFRGPNETMGFSVLGGIVWWKNQGSKISWHCPFNNTV